MRQSHGEHLLRMGFRLTSPNIGDNGLAVHGPWSLHADEMSVGVHLIAIQIWLFFCWVMHAVRLAKVHIETKFLDRDDPCDADSLTLFWISNASGWVGQFAAKKSWCRYYKEGQKRLTIPPFNMRFLPRPARNPLPYSVQAFYYRLRRLTWSHFLLCLSLNFHSH